MIADHEDSGLKYVFNAQEISNRLGLTEHEAHKQLEILAHAGYVTPHKSHDAYGVQMKAAGWKALDKDPRNHVALKS